LWREDTRFIQRDKRNEREAQGDTAEHDIAAGKAHALVHMADAGGEKNRAKAF
jgi:hypothetical protein